MVMSVWLEERMREKEEWRFATMEYGGQCVTMAGIKSMQLSSVVSLDMESKVISDQALLLKFLSLYSHCMRFN